MTEYHNLKQTEASNKYYCLEGCSGAYLADKLKAKMPRDRYHIRNHQAMACINRLSDKGGVLTTQTKISIFFSRLLCFTKSKAGIVFATMMVLSSFTDETLFGQIDALYPINEQNASVVCQLTFQLAYPMDILIGSVLTSPTAYIGSTEVAPVFYVVPTANLTEDMDMYSAIMKQYAVPSTLFFDSTTNIITIVPNTPYVYNTNYTVVFRHFPLLEPNIYTTQGYTKIYIDTIFTNHFKTISASVSISEISFQKTGDMVWNTTEDVVLSLSKPIAPKPGVIDSIFSLVKIEDPLQDSTGKLDYRLTRMSTTTMLDNNGTTITIKHKEPFEIGRTYFLVVKWNLYLGEDFYNSSHGFIVADQAFVNIKAHFPDSAKIGGLPEGEFRHKGYDGQKLYFRSDPNAQPIAPYGDTVRLGFPALYKEYYLSDWKLPNTTKANLHQNGEILELILDDDNFFSNAQGNSVFGDIKMKGIDIDAYYSLNPIDTLRISVQTNNAIAGMYPNYKKSTIVRGDIIGKLNDTTYTYYRYRKGEIYINDGLDYAVKSSFRFDTSITYKPLDSFKLDPNLRFSKIATIPYFDPSIKGGTVVIVIDKKYEPPKLCEQSQLDVAIHYDGSFLDNREFQAEMANIPNMIEYIELIDDRGNKWQPYFADSTSPAAVKTSSDRLIIPNGIDKTKNARARYRVSINNPDYEIWAVSTRCGYKFCSVDSGKVGRKGERQEVQYYYDYSLTPTASEVSGYVSTLNDSNCSNTLEIHIRRKIVELAFDMTNAGGTYVDPDPRVPNLKFFRFAFEDLSPIEIPHQYRPYFTNHEYPIDIYDPHAGYEKLFGEFIGIDRPVAGLKYHRRNGTEYDSDTINGLSREKVTVERASVFYYSGETFSYRPWIQEDCGYKFTSMTYPKRNKYEHFPNDHNKVVVYEFRNNDKFQGGVEKGFVLEYITVWQPKQGGGRKIVQYAIDENSATDKGIPMWNDAVLSDYDNGLAMYGKGGGPDLHSSGVRIGFKFNALYEDSCIVNNFNIYDAVNLDDISYRYLRPDSCVLSAYPLTINQTGQSHENVEQQGINEVWIDLIDIRNKPNKGTFHTMCNLQRFDMKITNTKEKPILSWQGDTLSNILPMRIFSASTVPPGIVSMLTDFDNFSTYDVHGGCIETYIHLYTLMDVLDTSKLSGVTRDSLGRITLGTAGTRYPWDESHEMCVSLDNHWPQWEDIGSTSGILRADQRILHSFHWADDNKLFGCSEVVDFASELANIIFAKDSVSKFISTIANITKKYLCGGDDYLGSNTFVLTKEDKFADQNNQWKYIREQEAHDFFNDIRNITDNDEANRIFEARYKQDWWLWGNGKHGLYKHNRRMACNIQFSYRLEQIVVTPPRPWDPKYLHRAIIPTAQSNFGTTIELWTGD